MSAPWIVLIAALWVLVVVLAVAVLGLGRRLTALEGTATTRAPRPPRPATAPAVGTVLPRIGALDRLLDAASGGVVLFVSSTCSPCRRLVEDLTESRLRLPGGAQLVVVTDADGAEKCEAIGAAEVIVEVDRAVITALAIPATPYALAVSAEGRVLASDYASKREALERVSATLGKIPSPALV